MLIATIEAKRLEIYVDKVDLITINLFSLSCSQP